MKFLLAVVVAALYLACVEAGIMDKPGYWYQHRERLGYFKDAPFTDLYKSYAAAFIYPVITPKRDADDFRNVLPSGDECMVFLKKFQIDDYKLRDVEEFVVLDACLGYLYQSTYHDLDRSASDQVAKNLDAFIGDQRLKALYEGTKMNEYEEDAKECVADLMWNTIRVKAQYPEVSCNNHYLQVYIEFAECHSYIPGEAKEKDSYFTMIYNLLKERAQMCFNNEILKMNEAVRYKYKNNPWRVTEHFDWRSLVQQKKERMWPGAISRLLLAINGPTKEISLREAHQTFKGISDYYSKVPTTAEEKAALDRSPAGTIRTKFLLSVGEYADSYIKPKKDSRSHRKDPSGTGRFNGMVDKLCEFFRSSSHEGYYDYATPIFRMLGIVRYPEVFGVSEEYFKDKVLISSHESGAIYISVSMCHILTFVDAAFRNDYNNGPLHYKAVFKPDVSKMIRWPNAGYY